MLLQPGQDHKQGEEDEHVCDKQHHKLSAIGRMLRDPATQLWIEGEEGGHGTLFGLMLIAIFYDVIVVESVHANRGADNVVCNVSIMRRVKRDMV